MIPIQILFYFFNFLGKLLVVATSQLENFVFSIWYSTFTIYLYPAEKNIEYLQ